jgi:methylase of polypeptide subunit release factors
MIQDLAKRRISDVRWWVNRNSRLGAESIADSARLERWKYDRVIRQKPLQYILGTQPFLGHELIVRRPILIPRVSLGLISH